MDSDGDIPSGRDWCLTPRTNASVSSVEMRVTISAPGIRGDAVCPLAGSECPMRIDHCPLGRGFAYVDWEEITESGWQVTVN